MQGLVLAVFLCAVHIWSTDAFSVVYNNGQQGRKLFGGYRITPKPCKAAGQTGVCMFTYECNDRKGELIGACMDGFLVGTCCKLDKYTPPTDMVYTDPLNKKPALTATRRPPTSTDLMNELLSNPAYHVDHPEADTVVYHTNGSNVEDFTNPDELFQPVTSSPGELSTFSYVSSQDGILASNQNYDSANYLSTLQTVLDTVTSKPGHHVTRPDGVVQTKATDSPHTSYSTNSFSDKVELIKPFEHAQTTKWPWSTTVTTPTPTYYSSRWPTNRPRPTVAFRPRPTSSSSSTRFKPRPTTPLPASAHTDENMILLPALNAEDPDINHSSLSPNVNSINDILNMLDENSPVEIASGETTQSIVSKNPGMSTWTSVTKNRPQTIPSFHYQSTPVSHFRPTATVNVPGPSFNVVPEGKPQKPEPAPTVIVLGPFASDFTSSRPVPTRKPVTIVTSSTGIQVSSGSNRPSYQKPTNQKPLTQVVSQQSNSAILRPPPSGVVVSGPAGGDGFFTATNPTINIEDFVVTQRPATLSQNGIITKRPTKPVKVTLVTRRPTTAQSGIYTNQPSYSPIITKRPPTTSNIDYEYQPSVADLSAFPPVRNPSLNTSGVTSQGNRPGVDVIVTPSPAINLDVDDDDLDDSVSLVEDDKLNDTMEIFVNKIVQSLQGNFQDLENVLYSQNQTEYEPTSRRPVEQDESASTTLRVPSEVLTTKVQPPVTTKKPSQQRPPVPVTTKRPVAKPPTTKKPTTPQKPVETQTSKPRPTRTTTPKTTISSTLKPKPPTRPKPPKPVVVADTPASVKPPSSRPRPTTASTAVKPPNSRPRPTTPASTDVKPVESETTAKPPKVSTTRRPTRPSNVTTKRPTPPKRTTTIATPVAVPLTTKRPRPSVTTRKPKPTKRPTTEATSPLLEEADEIVETSKPVRKTTTTSTTPETIDEEDEAITTKKPDYRRQCGVRPLMHRAKNGRIVGGKGSTFGEWPWQVLVRESTWLGLFTKNKCGGVLITNKYVMTAAHCQPGFLANLVAVFGEYDISGELESMRSVTKNVRRVIVHRHYDASSFANDLALLELESPVTFEQHIVPICMPQDGEDFTGRMATVSGWGRLKYGGGVPSVLQEVQVPVIENAVCQEMFQTAGHSKTILESFLCAGYANGQKDSCEGDSGGPLMIEKDDGRWVLVGTVSHGIKCAAPYLPGVYMRTTFYKPWLQSITGVGK